MRLLSTRVLNLNIRSMLLIGRPHHFVVSQIIYLIVVIYRGLLATYYLLINPDTGLFGSRRLVPAQYRHGMHRLSGCDDSALYSSRRL
jgi:hypothetical protein